MAILDKKGVIDHSAACLLVVILGHKNKGLLAQGRIVSLFQKAYEMFWKLEALWGYFQDSSLEQRDFSARDVKE